jgi:PKD repeat protein
MGYVMKKIWLYLFLILFIGSASYLAATDYYVDSSSGNDGNSGLSSQSAWRTVGRVNSFMGSLQPGDSVLFRRGQSFKGQGELYISASGTNGNYITIGTYGTGNKPILDKVRSSRSNLSYVAIQDLQITNGNTGISIYGSNSNHITISRCEVYDMSNNGIFLKMINTYIIEDCTIMGCGNGGIGILGSESYKITNGIIRNNYIGNIRDNDGISLHKEDVTLNECGPNHLLVNNVCFNSGENGIDITSGTDVILRGNETYGSGEGGILCGGRNLRNVWIDRHFSHDDYVGINFAGNVNVKLTSSIIYNARYHQLVIVPNTSCSNFEGYHNTIVYGPSSTGLIIDINNNVHGIKFKNNIVTSVQNNAPKTYIRFAGGATPASTNSDFDNNIYWRPDGNNSGRWNVGENISWSTWQGTWHMDTHGHWGNPLLMNPGDWDFHIRANSQAVDAGIDVDVDRDFEGTPIPRGLAPDIGADERDGATPLGADASASPQAGEAPVTVHFNADAWGGNSPYTYRWSFGDGSSSSQQNPSHTYSQAGNYTARLTVTDEDNNQQSDSVSITVTTVQSLSAGIVASPTSGQAPLTVSFTGSASGGTSPYTYSWTFGDGGSSTQRTPSHTYSQAGSFTARFTVTDSNGSQDSASIGISVSAPTAQLTATASASPMTGIAPVIVQFTGSASGGTSPYTFRWTFGDGSSSTQRTPSHAYSQPGIYTATFTVTDSSDQQRSASVSINVMSALGEVELKLSISTGQPAMGHPGSITPSPGSYFYNTGSVIQLRAESAENFRFARWIGDISDDLAGRSNFTLSLQQNRTLTALFCSMCGDVNGDLRLSPLDSQAVFDIFLGKNTNPTICQRENGDVNGDGTRTDPYISPADAQAIFIKYLNKGELPCDCSYEIRTAFLSPLAGAGETKVLQKPSQDIHLGLADLIRVSDTEVQLPVMINNPHNVDAFGFDLVYPEDSLEFLGVAKTEMVKEFYQVEGNKTGEGMLRVGGYSVESIIEESAGELVLLIFELKKKGINDSNEIYIAKTYDDVERAYYVESGEPPESKKATRYVRR